MTAIIVAVISTLLALSALCDVHAERQEREQENDKWKEYINLVTKNLRTLERQVQDLKRLCPERTASHRYVTEVHHLINNLAEVVGLKRNVHTPGSICPDMWVLYGTDAKEPMKTVLEPTGRLRGQGKTRGIQ